MDMDGLRAGTSPQRGVTLVELMVTLTVMSLVLALGVPAFSRLIASNRLASQTNELVGGLNLARSEAVRRAQSVALRSHAATQEYGGGWAVFTDGDGNGEAASSVTVRDGTVLRDLNITPDGVSVKRVTRSGSAGAYTYTEADTSMADRMYIVFNARGGNQAGRAAFFKVCDIHTSAVRGRIVQVSVVGRVSLDSSDEAC
jgi:type IV fimbrial biogenesis protein FimT